MLNIAVVGCGYWGPNLVRNFTSLSECNVAKICDKDEGRIEHLVSLYPNLKGTSDIDEVLNDGEIGAIAIATPLKSHFEMAKRSLLAGKHTLIEKPMASSVKECQELMDLAEKRKLTLMVGHTFLYSVPIAKIKELIDNGEIGDVLYISSRRLNLGIFQKDINVAWDLAPHDISIILYVLGKMPVSVNSYGRSHVNPNVEDISIMTLNFEDATFAIIQNSWLDPNKIREITFVGSKKMLLYDDIQPIEKIKIYDKSVNIPSHYDTFGEFTYAYHYGDMSAPYLKLSEPLKAECEHFLKCIRKSEKPLSSGENGLRTVQILEAATKSLKNDGAEVKLSF